MATGKNTIANQGLGARPSLRQKLRSLFKRKHTDKLGTISPSTTSSSPDIINSPISKSNLAQRRLSRQNVSPEKRRSGKIELGIANQFMNGGLMKLELEQGGLDDLKMSFENGDDFSFSKPKPAVRSPLSLEMPRSEGEDESAHHTNGFDSAPHFDQVADLPKPKKYEVKVANLGRPVSRASANSAAEKISKTIETINRNKITRQPLADLDSTNASKLASLESRRLSVDNPKLSSFDATGRVSMDMSKRHSFDTTKRDIMGTTYTRSETGMTGEKRPSSAAQAQARGRPQTTLAVSESAAAALVERNHSLNARNSYRDSMSSIQIRGGPQKPLAVMESAGISTEATYTSAQPLDPLKMHPPVIRGGPQKPLAVMESAGLGYDQSSNAQPETSSFRPVQIRGGPQKAMAVMESARQARGSSTSVPASHRHTIGDVDQLLKSEQNSIGSKRMSYPSVSARRSFSEGIAPVNNVPSSSTSFVKKPSGQKTAERLAWIRELEEGKRGDGNHGREYMFNRLQGGVKNKLAQFENQQLTGGRARTNSNVSRRQSTSSDAYSIEQTGLKRLSRTSALDDDFRKKLESVTTEQKKRLIPQEVLDLVALTDGDQEAALNDFMQNWNQDELIKQINEAADDALKEERRKEKVERENLSRTVLPSKSVTTGSSSVGNDFDPFGPTADLRVGNLAEKRSLVAESAAAKALRPTELPKVPTTSGIPKVSSWNPKPNLKSEPIRSVAAVKPIATPAEKAPMSKWNPKPAAPKAEPIIESETARTVPPNHGLPAVALVPAALVLGSNVVGSSLRSPTHPTLDKAKNTDEANAAVTTNPAPLWNPRPTSGAASLKKNEQKARSPNGTEANTLPSQTPAHLALGSATQSTERSPCGSPVKSTFTAAALPRFALA